MSSSQQSEMKLLLAGAWPALRPLPVFKYEAGEYRASIEFDKGRGEWLCRKTFLPSNKVEESRGGLAELAKALPPARAEAFEGCPATAHRGQEFARETGRRMQAILEWKESFENGAQYSELERHLSESQQREIEEILRLTLTARQLQFSAKNIEYVFDALSKAGGRLAILLEVAKRKSLLEEAEPAANVEVAASEAAPGTTTSDVIPAAMEGPQDEGEAESALPAAEQPALPELPLPELPEQSTPEVAVSVPAGSFDAEPASLLAEETEEAIPEVCATADRPQIRARRFDATANCGENPPWRRRALEISGVHIGAFAVLFLFAVISLPIGLTVGRGPLGQWFRDMQQSLFAGDAARPTQAERPVAKISKSPAPEPPVPSVDSDHSSEIGAPSSTAVVEEKPEEDGGGSGRSTDAPATVSKSVSTPESKHAAQPDAAPGREQPDVEIARAAPPAEPRVAARSFKAAGAGSRARKNRAADRFTPSAAAPPRRSASSGILVTTPAHGSRPFRVNFPEKPIAASSSCAMTSELSVLVAPDAGSSGAHPSSRLRAGELSYFVWPRYAKQGYGTAETVRVRATVGQFGQVLDVKLLSGSAALFPAARNAVHLWRYRPTLLNGQPISVQQDITIEFRPPQYLSQVRTQHSAHN